MISVLMNVFNEKLEWVKEAVESVNQDETDVEIIIVIDNPNIDDSLLIYLEGLKKNPNITVVRNSQNLGPANSANVALSYAKGEYIARLDSDDLNLPDRFKKELDYLCSNNADMVASAAEIIDEEGAFTGRYIIPNLDIYRTLPFRNEIVQSSVLIKASVIKQLGGYRNFRNGEDYDLWLRLYTGGYTIAVMREPLIKYRVRKSSLTSSRRYEQYILSHYVQSLFWERFNNSRDNHSESRLLRFLERKRITQKKNNDCQKAMEILSVTTDKGILGKGVLIAKAFIVFPNLIFSMLIDYIFLKHRLKLIESRMSMHE